MAQRGTNKRLSVDHEEHIARFYGGKRSASSGGAAHDAGDVRCPLLLIECKATMKRSSKVLREFEKITREAFAEGRQGALALRFYAPDSILADVDGWVDLIVRTIGDDRERENDKEYTVRKLAEIS